MRISDWSSDVCSSDLSGSRSDGPYYTPGVTPSREECVLAKMKTYAKVTKQTLTNIAEECELTVQSIEGHEKLRKAWEAREAARPPEPLPAAEPAKTQTEGDKLRRVRSEAHTSELQSLMSISYAVSSLKKKTNN